MKPVIFPIAVDGQGRVMLTFKELSDLLDKVYTAGKADGGEVHYDCPYRYLNPIEPNPSWTGTPIITKDYATISMSGDSTSTTTSSNT